jgi:hypothetical protein
METLPIKNEGVAANKHPNEVSIVSLNGHSVANKQQLDCNDVTPSSKPTTKCKTDRILGQANKTSAMLDLGHPDIRRLYCHRCLLVFKAHLARDTGRRSMDVACSMLQMTETLKQVFWMVKQHGDVSIAVGACADMDRLPDFNGVVVYPALLTPHKHPSKEGAILSYFPNLVEAISGKFNATPFVVAKNIPIDKIIRKAAFKIWPHSIKLSSDKTYPYDIISETFCNTQILSQQYRGEELDLTTAFDANLLAMENRLYEKMLNSYKINQLASTRT